MAQRGAGMAVAVRGRAGAGGIGAAQRSAGRRGTERCGWLRGSDRVAPQSGAGLQWRCGASRRRGNWGGGRELGVGRYLIVYRLRRADIWIIAVEHGARRR